MRDIAEELGVSTVAVSLALRNSPRISEELKTRVNALVKSSEFKIRNYPKRGSKNSFKKARVAFIYDQDNSDPVSQTIVTAVMQRLMECEMNFKTILTADALSDPFITRKFDGFLYYYNIPEAEISKFSGKPQVAIMNDYVDCGLFDNCRFHNEMAGKIVADYFLERGFKRFLFVYEEISTGVKHENHPRFAGFKERITDPEIKISSVHYSRKNRTNSFSDELMAELNKCEEPLGIFAFNDLTAFRCYCTLEMNKRNFEPGKLEMVCCDNTFLLDHFKTPIPVVDLHIDKVARAAVDRLIYRFQNPDECFVEILYKPDLILPKE